MAAALVYPDFILQEYLHTPAINAQITDLARQIIQPATTVAQTRFARPYHLLTNYRYSLDVPSLHQPTPLMIFC